WTRKEESETTIILLSQLVHFLMEKFRAQLIEIPHERQWQGTLRISANVAIEEDDVDEEKDEDVENHLE
ncbi:hypothetical protein PMAYCL1PPCAC_18049, partial [Pristionchus mayeri]